MLVRLRMAFPSLVVCGSLDRRLPNNLTVCLPELAGESIIGRLRDLAVSSGAACMSAQAEPSYVQAALGHSPALAATALRFGLHRFTTGEEVEEAADRVIEAVRGRVAEKGAAIDRPENRT
jgi:cysteine desulfurase